MKTAVLKCNICGGELNIDLEKSVGVCQYCGSTIMIPKNLERKENLYNRAAFLRQNNEFDKAEAAYEDILKEDNEDPDAHWGLVLSKFGIEYVADPHTGKYLPTCHRTQKDSVLTDPDYLAALACADPAAKEVLQADAEQIHQIQMKILEISRKEPPYDIFICYKESDENGARTEDSTLAQDLYYELTKKGYKVFFARKTLESKLGTDYEPIIYAALNSARVMIVLGTKPEHFGAVWVRNEWSRFRKMQSDQPKTIIPAYRGMSPYELPTELSSLQSQDMSKIGFMQDLTDGIERCLRSGSKATESAPAGGANNSLERLVEKSEIYLRLRDLEAAKGVFQTLTKEYPEDYRGWWGLLICKTKMFSVPFDDLTECDKFYSYVNQLAPADKKEAQQKEYADYLLLCAQQVCKEEKEEMTKFIDESDKLIAENNQQLSVISAEISKLQKKQAEEIKKAEKVERGFFERPASWLALCMLIASIIGVVNTTSEKLKDLGLPRDDVWNIFLRLLHWGLLLFSIFCVVVCVQAACYGARNISGFRKNAQSLSEKIEGLLRKNQLIKQSVTTYQNFINSVKQYLSLEEKRRSAYHHGMLCHNIGIAISVDSEVETMRNATLATASMIESEDQKKVTVEKAQVSEPAQKKIGYDVVLSSYGEAKLDVIRAVRSITGLGLVEAKELVENVPQVIKKGISESEAKEMVQLLSEYGAYAQITKVEVN